MRRFVLALISVTLCLQLAVSAQSYVEVRTPNFTLATDLGEAQARNLAEHFEQVRSAFGIFFNKREIAVPLPLTIVAFKSSRDFQQFVPKFTGNTLPMWPGTVRKGEDENLIAFETSSPTEGRRPAATFSGHEFADHEYVKLLISGNFPPVPAWYEDGVLEYCSSIRIGNKQLVYGVQRPDLMSVLQSKSWLRAVQLFGPPPAAADDWEAQRHSIFYAQAWITIHYLMANRLGRQLNTFVDLVQNQHIEAQEAIRRAFGVEPQSFENAVHNYFTLGIAEYKLTPPADFGKTTMEVRKLRELDWLAIQADLHYHSTRDHDLGVTMYNKILTADPNSAMAHRGLGYSYLQRNEFDKAAPHLQKALASDPDDARNHYFLALLASKRARATDGTVDLAAMKQHLQKAIELYPNYADAYQLLSWTESELKNTDAAHAAIEKAAELNPRNDFYALTSVQFDLQAKQYDKARPVLERLQGSDQPEVARFAHQALANMGPRKEETSINSPRQQITAPQWQPKEPEAEVQTGNQAVAANPPAPPVDTKPQKIEFLKGEVVSVDCSKAPTVSLIFAGKGKRWVMYARDVQKLMLIGVENFSCNWMNRKASVNYRLEADGRGEMISLEID
jgi:tetratricopeptide (TPR) repeat protein